MDKRYRLIYGETHTDMKISDDKEKQYIGAFPVELLNEQDNKINVMEEKLSELGYELWFVENISWYDKETKREYSKTNLTKNPDKTSMGVWAVLPEEQIKIILGKNED